MPKGETAEMMMYMLSRNTSAFLVTLLLDPFTALDFFFNLPLLKTYCKFGTWHVLFQLAVLYESKINTVFQPIIQVRELRHRGIQ